MARRPSVPKKLQASPPDALDPAQVYAQAAPIRADVEALIPRWAAAGYETMAMAMVLTSIALGALGDAYGAAAVLNFIEGLKDSDLVRPTPRRAAKRGRGLH